MPKRLIILLVTLSSVLMGVLLTSEITLAVDNPGANSRLAIPYKKTPTDTPTKRPTKTPKPTSTPKATSTPRNTSTPNISGTKGVVPTAIQGPPPGISAGVGALDSPGSLLVDPLIGKMFIATGFPGVSTGVDEQGYYQYAKNRLSGPTLWATWYVQVQQSGYYDVYAYVPTSPNATHSAQYHIFQNNVLSPPIVIDQALSAKQWVNLGSYYLLQDAVGTQYITLNNQTNEDDTTTVVLCSTVYVVFRP